MLLPVLVRHMVITIVIEEGPSAEFGGTSAPSCEPR